MWDELTDSDFERYELEEEAIEDDCMECGVCDSCIERTKEFYEYMENEQKRESRPGTITDERGSPSAGKELEQP